MQEELIKKYLISIEQKGVLIKSLWEKFLQGDKTVLEEIRLHAHSLKGSGATFGFPEISESGKNLEEAHDTELLERVNELLNMLGRITARKISNVEAETDTAEPAVEISYSKQALIIERNTENGRLIGKCVGRLEGIENCVLVETGSQAQEKFRTTRYSLIVLDLVLPDQDGREILREIKESPDFNCPVLVISGVVNDSIYMECMTIGADEYLSKPFDTDQLFFEAQDLVRRNTVNLDAASDANLKSGALEKRNTMSLKGMKILVAEDDEIQGIFITQKLNEQGAEVVHVENGQLALNALADNEFSAVILDGMMPVMDGFEALQAIRSKADLQDLPVIMVTAMGSEENIVRGYDLGANDYILKPFSEAQLVNRIKSLFVVAS